MTYPWRVVATGLLNCSRPLFLSMPPFGARVLRSRQLWLCLGEAGGRVGQPVSASPPLASRGHSCREHGPYCTQGRALQQKRIVDISTELCHCFCAFCRWAVARREEPGLCGCHSCEKKLGPELDSASTSKGSCVGSLLRDSLDVMRQTTLAKKKFF